jgi:hypothetical protein
LKHDFSVVQTIAWSFIIVICQTTSSLVFPPYRGEGVWVRQGPWELCQR